MADVAAVSMSPEICRSRQKKRPRWNFRPKPIDPKLIVTTPSVRIFKLYSRFNRLARDHGWLKNPVAEPGEPTFEAYNVTSAGSFAALSPMVLGPVVDEFGDLLGCNIEDCWQGSKVWTFHVAGGFFDKRAPVLWRPGRSKNWEVEWKKWSEHIRFSGEGKRHRAIVNPDAENPNIPLYSSYRGLKLTYVRARKLMYIRWYAKLAAETEAYKYLRGRFGAGVPLALLDFDADSRESPSVHLYRDHEATRQYLKDRIDDPLKIFGHGCVLACMLCGVDVWSDVPFESDVEGGC